MLFAAQSIGEPGGLSLTLRTFHVGGYCFLILLLNRGLLHVYNGIIEIEEIRNSFLKKILKKGDIEICYWTTCRT